MEDRRTQIERIIAGSLIADFAANWPEVRTKLDEDMFADQFSRKVFEKAKRLNAQGTTPDLPTIAEGWTRQEQDMATELAVHQDFFYKNWAYRIDSQAAGQPTVKVTFSQYVDKLLQYEITRQKQLRDRPTA